MPDNYGTIRLIQSHIETARNLLLAAANEASLFDSALEGHLDDAAGAVNAVMPTWKAAHVREAERIAAPLPAEPASPTTERPA